MGSLKILCGVPGRILVFAMSVGQLLCYSDPHFRLYCRKKGSETRKIFSKGCSQLQLRLENTRVAGDGKKSTGGAMDSCGGMIRPAEAVPQFEDGSCRFQDAVGWIRLATRFGRSGVSVDGQRRCLCAQRWKRRGRPSPRR